MVGPNVGGLHSGIAVLTISNGITRQSPHKVHFTESASGIFDEPKFRDKRTNQSQQVLIDSVAGFSIVRDRSKVAVQFLPAVVADGRDAVGGTVW